MKQYLGILISAVYALAIRIISEFGIIEINSIGFLFITPVLISFVPFFLRDREFLNSPAKVALFPVLSVLLFILLALLSSLEDIPCILIIGAPYALISVIVSLVLREILKYKDDEISRNALPIFIIPIVLGAIEKQFPKTEFNVQVQNEIIINASKEKVWDNLLSVPDLSESSSFSFVNFLGIPRPVRSTYDPISNTRLGYFENDLILNESVIERIEHEKLVFNINIEKSEISHSPTINHVLQNKYIEFENIQYQITEINDTQIKLHLGTSFKLHSNIPFYSKQCSRLIINDFEQNILRSLKILLEG